MINPNEVNVKARKKENENVRFRTFLKNHADEETLDKQFFKLHQQLLTVMIAVNVEIAVKCMQVVSPERTSGKMQNICR